MRKIIVLAALAIAALLVTSVASGVWFTSVGGDAASLAEGNGNLRANALWSSGWVDIATDTAKTLTHNLGGNPDDYAVDLWFLDAPPGDYGINERCAGGLEAGGKFYGVYWQNLTDKTIEVFRHRDDTLADKVHVNVWQPDPPAWDSGWVDIATGTAVTLPHNLGGDVDDYIVGLWFKDTEGMGINTRCYGGLEAGGKFYGAGWENLTDATINVFRYRDDIFADQVRVRIFIPDPPHYDSGWVDIAPGTAVTLTHNLGGNPNLYVVRGWQKDTDGGIGINHRFLGGFEAGGKFFGTNWQSLTDTTISVFRFPDDWVADQVRVRIWKREFKVYLPIVLKNYAPIVETEIAYDDGAVETTDSWETGKGFAVRFSPTGQVKVVRARYYLQDPRPIAVHFWDANRNDLIAPFTANTTQEGWNDVDLSPYNVTVSGDFYLGFFHLEDYRPTLGVDTSSPDGRSFEVDGAYWEQQSSDYMIRAVVVQQ